MKTDPIWPGHPYLRISGDDMIFGMKRGVMLGFSLSCSRPVAPPAPRTGARYRLSEGDGEAYLWDIDTLRDRYLRICEISGTSEEVPRLINLARDPDLREGLGELG